MKPKAPWHLWVVGVLGLLWNAAGTYTILMGQAGKLANMSAEDTAWYAAQPLWHVIVTDIALLGAVIACVLLLLRSRWAVPTFIISLAAIVIANVWDLFGPQRMLANSGALIATCLILVIAILLLVYASRQRARGVLT